MIGRQGGWEGSGSCDGWGEGGARGCSPVVRLYKT